MLPESSADLDTRESLIQEVATTAKVSRKSAANAVEAWLGSYTESLKSPIDPEESAATPSPEDTVWTSLEGTNTDRHLTPIIAQKARRLAETRTARLSLDDLYRGRTAQALAYPSESNDWDVDQDFAIQLHHELSAASAYDPRVGVIGQRLQDLEQSVRSGIDRYCLDTYGERFGYWSDRRTAQLKSLLATELERRDWLAIANNTRLEPGVKKSAMMQKLTSQNQAYAPYVDYLVDAELLADPYNSDDQQYGPETRDR